jgi:maleylacetate reductase
MAGRGRRRRGHWLAKIVARDLGLPILAVPTTIPDRKQRRSGDERGERKFTGRTRASCRARSSTTRLTLALPAAASAASAMNAIAHCVEGLWVPDGTPFLAALAADAARRLPRICRA